MNTLRSFDSPGLAAPPSSFNTVEMPDVFVIPPEEEHSETPPFCYFDASKAALSTNPDIESVDIALNVHQQIANTAPIFHRALEQEVIMPVRRSTEEPASPISQCRSEDEDDIVEVYKVGKEIPSVAGKKEPMSRSKTFRARASQALRSIKNVGKSSRKQPTPAQSVPSLPPTGDENARPITPSVASRAGKNTLSKRRSRPLSQIFRFNQDEEPATEAIPPSPTGTVRPTSPAFSIASPSLSPASPTRTSMQASILGSLRPSSPSPQPGPSRPTSPLHYDEPPASPDSLRPKSASFRKRLSFLELPRLFSSSSTTSTASSASTPSTASLDYPPSDVPATPSPSMTALARRSSQSSSKRSWTTSRPGDDDNEEEDYGEIQPSSLSVVKEEDSYANELSLEMRLDSLHFDSLSFDPNDFTFSSIRGHGTQIEVN